MDNDLILTNLNIIGMVREGGRLYISNDNFTLETFEQQFGYMRRIHSIKNSLFRFISHNNRNTTFLKIQNTILQAFDKLNCLKEQILKESEEEGKLIKYKWLHDIHVEKLKLCVNGLENLKKTYEKDAHMCSKLDILIAHINQKLS